MIRTIALAAAILVPALVATQFLLVGYAVFADGAAWSWHRAVGGVLALPVLGLATLAFAVPAMRAATRPAALLAGFYLMQFGWLALGEALGVPALRALHAVNALAVAALGDAVLRTVLRATRPAPGAVTAQPGAA